jgi:hypothetical protein
MDLERLFGWLDNPILVKHVRSRLRQQPVFAGMVVVVALCLCMVWAGYQLNWFVSGRAYETLWLLQAIILVVMGGSQVSAAVSGARTSGVLDFHRVSPLTPATLVLGFFFGAPIREYVLYACTLPFAALCIAIGAPTFGVFVQTTIVLVATAWLVHGLALLDALVSKGTRSARGVVALTLVFLVLFYNVFAFGAQQAISLAVMAERQLTIQLFGVPIPWLAVVLLYVAAALLFVFLATRRKMGSERIHALSKPQAIAAMATAALLLVAPVWRNVEATPFMLLVVYLLGVVAILLTSMITASRAEYTKGLWRALKRGQSQLPWWDDLALNLICVVVLSALVLVAGTMAWQTATQPSVERDQMSSRGYSLALATGVLVTAYFGLALQYFALRFGARGRIYYGLFLFVAWLLPLVAAAILASASVGPGRHETAAQTVASLSPLAGIAATGLPIENERQRLLVQGAAITPALLFVFVFHSLLVSARRRLHREVVGAQGAKVLVPSLENVPV